MLGGFIRKEIGPKDDIFIDCFWFISIGCMFFLSRHHMRRIAHGLIGPRFSYGAVGRGVLGAEE